MSSNSVVGRSPVDVIQDIALGYLLSRSLHVATELGIADHLALGPKSIAELAADTGAHGPSLYRLLRTLAAHGVFAEDDAGRFATTPAAGMLQRGVMRDGVLLCGEVAGDGTWWNAVGALRDSVMTGEPAFEQQNGVGFFEYVKERPECAAWFDRGMANFAAAENPAIASAYDFGLFQHVVDVGGGQGGLLAEILKRYPNVRATLYDLPDVISRPDCLKNDAFHGRWSAVAGDFFDSVPGGGDVYVLKRIMHDWNDADCERILQCCRRAMTHGSRLLIADAVIPKGNVASPGKVMDILMMVFARGRERTAAEFTAILQTSGLRLSRILSTPSALSVIEAIPT